MKTYPLGIKIWRLSIFVYVKVNKVLKTLFNKYEIPNATNP